MNWASQKVAFIGTGQMATALSAGFVRNLLKPDRFPVMIRTKPLGRVSLKKPEPASGYRPIW